MNKSLTSSAMLMFYGVSAAGAGLYLMTRGGSPPFLSSAYLLPVAGGVATSFVATKGLTAEGLLSSRSMAIKTDGSYNMSAIATSAVLGAVGAAATQGFGF